MQIKSVYLFIAMILCVVGMSRTVVAQEAVGHADQYATVVSLFQGAQKAVALQKDLSSGRRKMNNMLGGKGRYLSPLLRKGNSLLGTRSGLLRAQSMGNKSLGAPSVMKNYRQVSRMIDKNLAVKPNRRYSDSQRKTLRNNQRDALADFAATGMAYSAASSSVSGEEGSKAVDVEAITESVNGANDLQAVFQTLTASDRQNLSNQLTLTSTEATIGMLVALQSLGDASKIADSDGRIEKTEEAEVDE